MREIEDCTAVILAGGESRRMGKNKGDVRLANITLLNHATQNMQSIFTTILISVREPRQDLMLPHICDSSAERGPMSGLLTALEQVQTSWVFLTACDMPFISPILIAALAEKRQSQNVVVSCVQGHLQPLAAFYSVSCLPKIRQQMADGHRSLKQLIESLDSTVVDEDECRCHDATLISFMDLDTQDDLEKAAKIMAKNS